MSEANHTWRVDVDGTTHEIESRHNTTTGKIVVLVDGHEVGEDRIIIRDKHIEFEVEGHPARVDATAEHGGFGIGTGLHVDGRYVEPLRK